MSVFQLSDDLVFPHPSLSCEDGLLAVGGDLSPQRLILAYSNGIFPWYSKDEPLLWWSPDPRLVLFPKEFRRHKNLRKLIRSEKFSISMDKEFGRVIKACSIVKRERQTGTWITTEIINAYTSLFEIGVAHSVEVWLQGDLVGGLYGLALGKVFFGESMFHTVNDASKVALWYLVGRLSELGFKIIDVQQDTPHLRSLGARLISRIEFLEILKQEI